MGKSLNKEDIVAVATVASLGGGGEVFGEDLFILFFFGLHLLLNPKPTDFWRCDLFFWSSLTEG